jgi:hypothetical protein
MVRGKGAAEQVDGFADAIYKGFYTLKRATHSEEK